MGSCAHELDQLLPQRSFWCSERWNESTSKVPHLGQHTPVLPQGTPAWGGGWGVGETRQTQVRRVTLRPKAAAGRGGQVRGHRGGLGTVMEGGRGEAHWSAPCPCWGQRSQEQPHAAGDLRNGGKCCFRRFRVNRALVPALACAARGKTWLELASVFPFCQMGRNRSGHASQDTGPGDGRRGREGFGAHQEQRWSR